MHALNVAFVNRPATRVTLTSLACGVVAAAAMIAAPLRAHGQTDTQKANNTDNLLLGTSWVSGAAPTTSNVLVWSSTVTGANTVALGGSGTVAGIKILNPGGLVTIGNAAGNVLGIGASGIDMSSATQNLAILSSAAASDLRVTANQDWNIASGRTLQLFSNSGSVNTRLTGNADITVKGGGTVSMLVSDPGGAAFNPANGNGTYSGNWTISGGSKVISQRNGTQAFGSGTITLDSGIISQQNGGWSYSNAIVLKVGGGTVTNDSGSVTNGRYLNLTGVISGTGGLTIANNNGAWGEGVILTGASTFTGAITINSNGVLRIGGDATTTMNGVAPGTLGSISSSASITNNGILGFGWNDIRTFANNVAGTGLVRLGRTSAGGQLPAGYVTLSGTNTYSGGTQVNSGGLIFSSTAARPGTGTVTVGAAGAIGLGVGASPTYYTATDIDNLFNGSPTGYSITAGAGIGLDTSAGDFTYSSNVGAVSRALFKSGSNTLTLAGNNAYTGATTVVAGTLSVSADSNLGAVPGSVTAGNVKIRENASLRVTTGFTLSTNRSIALGPTSGSGTGTIAVDASQTLTFGGTMANNGGTGSLGKAGAGTLTLTSTGNSYTGDTLISNGTLKISGGKLYNAGFNNTAVITINSGGTLELDSFGYDTLGSTGQLADYGQRRLLNGGSINVIGNSHSTGNDFYVANASSGTFTMATAGQTLTLSGNNNTNIAIGGPLTFGGAGNIVVNEVIENNTGAGSIVKAGAGTLTLAGVNTYTGATTINAGTVSVAADTGLGAAPGAFTAGSLVVNGGALAVTTGFTLSANRGVAVGPASGSGTGSFDVASGQTLTYGGTIANNGGGTGGLTKIGAGTLALSGASTYTGPTAIDAGVLQIGAGGSAGSIASSSAVSVGASGTLAFNRSNAFSFASPISGAGTILKLGSVETGLTGSNSFSGFIDIQAGKLAFENANAAAGTPSVNVASGAILSLGTALINGTATIANLTGSGTIDPMYGSAGGRTLSVNPTTTGTYSGIIRDAISGAARTLALVKAGPNTLALAGTATYTGPTTINGGTLRIEGAGVVSGSSAMTIANVAGATFDMNGTSQTVGGLAGGGATGGAVELGVGTLTVNKAAGSDTFSGAINGAGGLVKAGAGALVLDGGIGYGGPTTITGGTLQIGGTSQLGGGSYAPAIANDGAFVFASSANQTLSGVVSGLGSLTHSGAGAVTLTGGNTYTGSTTIGSGTLEVGGAGRLGGGAYAGAIANDGALRFTTSANQTLSGGITGNGSLLKSGAGRLTLTGANTYAGATTVDGGRLVVNGTVGSGITVNTGATLGGSGTVADVTLAGGGIVSPGNSPGLLTVANMTWSGTSAYDWEMYDYASTEGSGWDSIFGSGTLTVNATTASPFTFNLLSLSGTSTLGPAFKWSQTTSGSFRVASFTGGITLAEPSGTWWSFNTGGFTPFDPATGAFSLSTTSNDMYLVYTYTPPPSFVWTVGSGSWSTASNWDTNTAPSGQPELFFSGAGGTATNDIVTGTGVGEIATVKGITFTGSASGGYTLDGNAINLGTLGVTNDSSFEQALQNGITLSADSTLNAATAGLVFSGTIDTAGDILTVTGSSTTTLTSVVTGAGSLVKLGSGTLALRGANDYTGGTTINAGTVVVGDGATSGDLPGNVTNNASLVFDRTDDITFGGDVAGSGSLTKLNGNTLTLSGSVGYAGPTTISSGSIVFASAANQTLAGAVGGAGGLRKAGGGTLALTGVNTYAGDTTISGGTLALTGSAQLGAGTYAGAIANDGVLSVATSANQTLSGSVGGTGSLVKTGAGTLTLTNSPNGYTGGSTISGGTVSFASGGLGPSGAVTLGNASLRWAAGNTDDLSARLGLVNATTATLDTNGNDVTLATGFGGSTSAAVTKVGGGTLALGGNNTYAGVTTISGGTLQLGVGGAGGSVAGTIVNNAALVFNRSDAVTYAGLVSGAGSLTQAGSGAVTLTATNTYTGPTTVTSGLLSIGGGGATGQISASSAVTIAAGGTLAFNRSAGYTVANAIAGAGVLRQQGTNDLELTGSNAFSGRIDVVSGKVALNGVDSAAGAPSVNVNGTLSLGSAFAGGTATISGLTGSGTVDPQFAGGNDTRTLAINQATSGTFTGLLRDATTASRLLAVVKGGAGTLTLTGANSYTGGTTLAEGTIRVGNNAALGTGQARLDGGTISSDGATSRTLANGLVIGGPITLGNAVDSGTLTFSGTVSLGGVTREITAASDVTMSGVISNGGLTKSGTGTLTLTAANTFTGPTTVSTGTLRFTGAGAVASSSGILIAAGAAFDWSRAVNMAVGISGSGTVIRSNAGNAVFSGANSGFEGSWLVTSGYVGLVSDGNLGAPSVGMTWTGGNGAGIYFTTTGQTLASTRTVTLSGAGGTLNGSTGHTGTFAALFTGTGSLYKVSGATAILTNVNDFTGGIFNNTGTLEIGGAGKLGGATGNYGGAISNVATLTFSTSENQTLSGSISGAGALNKTGVGTLTLTNVTNTYSGNATVTGGTLSFVSGALGSTGLVRMDGGTLRWAAGNTQDLGSRLTLLAGKTAGLDTNGNDVTLGSALSGGAVAAGLAKLGNGTLTLTATSVYTGPTTISGGTLAITGAGQLGGGSYAGAITNDAAFVFAASSNQTLSGPLSGTGTLAKTGAGTLTLSGGNTSTGETTISTGTLVIGGGGIYSAPITNNATLRVDTSADPTLSGAIGGTGGLVKSGNGSVTLSGVNTFAGGVSVSAGVLLVGNDAALSSGTVTLAGGGLAASGGTPRSVTNPIVFVGDAALGDAVNNGLLTIDGGVDLGGAARQIATPSNVTIASAITNGGLTKAGAGALTLSASNSFAGGLTVAAGALRIGNDAALSTGTVTLNGGALSSDGATARTIANTVVVGGNVTLGDATNTGPLAFNGPVDFGGATRLITTPSDVTIAAAVSNGGLTKAGAGTLTLSASNSYTGATTISGGTLALSGDGDISSASTALVSMAPGATLDISAASGGRTIGALDGGDTSSQVLLGGHTLRSVVGAYTVFGGVISGSGGFTKAGGDTLELTSGQAFSGVATVQAGNLLLASGNALATAARIQVSAGASLETYGDQTLTVVANQILGGFGDINGALTLLASSTLSPGGSVGTLNNGGLAGSTLWSGGMHYLFEINDASGTAGQAAGGWDLFTATNTLTLAAGSEPENQIVIDLTSLSGTLPGLAANFSQNANYQWLIADAGAEIATFDATWFRVVTTNFLNLPGSPEMFSVVRGDTLGFDSSQLYVVYAAVPEPGTLALAGIGLAVSGWAALRRRPRPRRVAAA